MDQKAARSQDFLCYHEVSNLLCFFMTLHDVGPNSRLQPFKVLISEIQDWFVRY